MVCADNGVLDFDTRVTPLKHSALRDDFSFTLGRKVAKKNPSNLYKDFFLVHPPKDDQENKYECKCIQ